MTTENNHRKAVVLMLHALVVGTHSRADLASISGLSVRSVSAWLEELRYAKLCYVAEYRQDTAGRPMVEAFRLGRDEDKERPAPLTRVEITQRHRARRKGKTT